jgi:hypothetical protein
VVSHSALDSACRKPSWKLVDWRVCGLGTQMVCREKVLQMPQ